MKHLKKLAGVLLALVMVMALAAPAFATPTTTTAPTGDGPTGTPGSGNNTSGSMTGSITVKEAVEGASTTIYKIFDLVQYDQATNAYIYKVNSAWDNFFNTGAGAAYVTIAANGDVSWKTGMGAVENMKAFVAAAMEYAETPPDGLVSQTEANNSGTKDPAVEDKIQTYTLKFDDLELGYWLVSSTDGAMCSLNTNAPNAVITNKNPQSKPDKEPKELTTEIGQNKEYTITFTAYPTGVKYTVTDTAGTGLSFSQTQFDAMTITADGETLEAANYTATKTDDGFKIVFNEAYVSSLSDDGTEIVISYSMTVTEDAIVGYVENDAVLEYGPNGDVKDHSKPKVYTYNFDLVKTNPSKDLLPGAEFELYYDEDMTRKVPLIRIDDTHYRVAVGDENDGGAIVVTGGKVNIAGLDEATYYLKETKAPTGYNPADGAIEVKIESVKDAEGNATQTAAVNGKATTAVTTTDNKYDKDGVAVENKTGSLLPSTGGIGTTIFYIVGGVLAVGAVVVLIAKRRTGAEEE